MISLSRHMGNERLDSCRFPYLPALELDVAAAMSDACG